MLLNYLSPSFQIGPLTLHLYGLSLAAALLLGLALALRGAAVHQINRDHVWECAVYAIIGAIAGARILSVLLNFNYFLADPLYLFRIHEGGLAFFGGLAGGALAAIWYAGRRQLDFWVLADIYAPSLALGEAITRLGCDVYGFASPGAPWPRLVGGVAYHNIPLYMGAATLLLFAVLWYLRGKVARGQLFLIYLAVYFSSRAFIDFYRGEAVIGVFNPAQLGSIAILVLVLLAIFRRKKAPVRG
jgi:phosphatidylglycerol---prolipoprotein diacylglyceryl transferase